MAQTSVSELFSKCHARIGRAVHHSNEAAEIWNGLDIMHLLAVTLFVRDDGTGTLDVDQVEPLPENLELELGEFLYQLRAALDGAVYASAIQDSGQNPPPKTSSIEFPICERKEEWAKQSRKIALLNAGRRRFIEVTQPFAEPPLEASLLVLNSNRCLQVLKRTSSDRQASAPAYPHRRISMDRPLFELPQGTRLEKLEVRPMSSSEGPAARFSLSWLAAWHEAVRQSSS
jgi:hypothetical protein